MQPLAHVKQLESGQWRKQLLEDHLRQVGALTAEFATFWDAAVWGKMCGLLHDLGKAHPRWQAYLKRNSRYDPEAHLELDGSGGARPNHSSAGAAAALEGLWGDHGAKNTGRYVFRALAYAVAGHHAGLADWRGASGSVLDRLGLPSGELNKELFEEIRRLSGDSGHMIEVDSTLLERLKERPTAPLDAAGSSWAEKSEHFHLWVRMLFSALVDADSLDTEAFCQPESADLRKNEISFEQLKNRFDEYMTSLAQTAKPTLVNKHRQQVLSDCRQAAELEPGLFSLTVPTGGGKTLSSMAFALEHALRWDKRRIVVAIPFTSIIEQTASQLRKVFGDLEAAVLEHHSNLDPDRETRESLLAAENWDVPVVVTTNVQIFESLLGSRRSQCRKLHNLAQSVIILDEAQTLPLPQLRPLLSVLRGLIEYFGVTVVLCTATQPVLSRSFTAANQKDSFKGLPPAREIVTDSKGLFASLKRVVRLPTDIHKIRQWPDLAEELLSHPRVLTVVNRRQDSRELYEALRQKEDEGLFHLSALMCAEHRSDQIATIKEYLADPKNKVRVVSTQLIEAGVDIDFPRVYRALCGLASAVQAAGRCNREGFLEFLGELILFAPPTPSPRGLLHKGEQILTSMLKGDPDLDLFDPKVISCFFERYYADVARFDEAHFYDRLVAGAERFEFSFRSFSEAFNLIENQGQQSIFVQYRSPRSGIDSATLLRQLQKEGTNRDVMRRLQRFTVMLSKKTVEDMVTRGTVMMTEQGFYVQTSPDAYDMQLGLRADVRDSFVW